MNKVALITGSAKRIGAAITKRLHDSGLNTLVHYHESDSHAEELLNELNFKRPNSAYGVRCDLMNFESYDMLIESCIDQFGRLDVLINNASAFFPTPIDTLDKSQWDKLFTVNVEAPAFLIKQASEHLKQNNGCVINMTDIHGEKPLMDYPVYSASKAALIMLTKAMAKQLAPFVRVNAISPGAIDWPVDMSESTQQAILNKIPLQKAGAEKDITDAVLYLIENADYITGQVITVDGGRTLYS